VQFFSVSTTEKKAKRQRHENIEAIQAAATMELTGIPNFFTTGTGSEPHHYLIFFNLEATASLLGPDIFLSTVFSNILTLCSFLNVKDYVSYPYKSTA
jgi:hypothetical protein